MNLIQHRDVVSFPSDSHRSSDELRLPIVPPLAAVGKAAARTLRVVALALLLAGAGLPITAYAQNCAPVSQDLLVSTNPGAALIRPRECSVVEQTPPDFSWPFIGTGPYTVTLTFPDSHIEQRTATHNWLNWNGTLPAGNYTWTVTHADQTSQPRQFTVSTIAVPFVVPDMTSVISQLLAKPHPRGMPDTATLQAMASQRTSQIQSLERDVNFNFNDVGPLAGSEQMGNGTFYGKAALKALTLYAYNGSATYRDHAKTRVLRLASWDPRGPTALDDEEATFVAWVVTLGYDWLGSALTATEQIQVLESLNTRIGDLYNWVIGPLHWPTFNPPAGVNPPLWQYPRDSHRNMTAGLVAMISTLLVGDLPAANSWVQDLLPFALNVVSPYSGEEGGYSNGTPYSLWNVGMSLSPWYVLRWATCGSPQTCIDLAQKAWVRNYGRFLAYFVPPTFAAEVVVHDARSADPGTPIGLFGDGFAEPQLFEERSRYGKGYTHFAPSALGCWYAAGLVREDFTRIEYLMSPPNTCASTAFPSGTANSLFLPSVGWLAMHSDLADLNRTSVYFKSSPRPFGAYNHQSADQNAFVVNAGGERLAIESGYYNDQGAPYDSDHWQFWVKRTKSKNAITFDGGQGQHAYEHAGPDQFTTIRYGSITQQQSTADFDIVTGDATDAYNGALTKAVRSLVYLRPGAILVYDNVASSTARTWEWNLHALNPFTVVSDSRVRITKGTQSLCVDMLAGPGVQFTQSSAWPPDAPTPGPQQSHGKFASTQASTAAEFIALMRVNVPCDDTLPAPNRTNGIWTVPVDNRTVTIAANGGVTVGPTDITPPTVSITSPANGTTVSGTLTVTASAADNVGVAGVQFKYNGVNFDGEDTTAPYSVSGDTRTVPNGSYTLTAVARDTTGSLTASAPVTITVINPNDTTPPTVSITSPASGATVSGTLTVTASAADDVRVAGVQFKYNGVNFDGEDTTAPYSVSGDTRTVPNGSYTLTAVARDTAGNLTTSAPVTITVSNPNDTTPPTVSITSPANGTTVSGTLTVTASAADDVGVAGVQFKYNGVNLDWEDTTAPYSVSGDTRTVPNGSYTLTAVARDTAGNLTTSAPVTITVSNPNDTTPPTVSITSPANGTTVSGTLTVTASAADDVGVAGVQFKYNGVNLDWEDTTAPYSVSGDTRTVPNGSYTLTAVARDTAGNLTTSAPVTITVSNL
jgi:hypothetical protein